MVTKPGRDMYTPKVACSCSFPTLRSALIKLSDVPPSFRPTDGKELKMSRCPSRLLRKLVGYNTDVTGDSDRNSSARPSRLCSEDLLDWCLNNSLTELFHPLSNRRGKGEERMSNSNPIEVYASHLLDEKPIKPDKVLCDLIQKVSKQDSSKTLKRMLIDDAIDSDRTTPHFGMPSPRKKGNSKMSSEHIDMDEYDTDVHSTCGINEFPENTQHLLNLSYGSPRATSSGLPAGAVSENASSGFDAVIDLALASEEAGSFDLPELHEAFLKFFEEGAVSDELDDYFTKVLESEGLHCFETKNGSRTCHLKEISTTNSSRGATSDQRWINRRIRNNEASRRCRASQKARFHTLLVHLEQLRCDKRELCIWMRELRLAIRDAKLVLMGARGGSVRDIAHN